jgi:hypothetical protein
MHTTTDKVLKVIKDKESIYLLKHCVHGYYAEVRPRSRIKYMRELFSDFMGASYTHPVWFSNFHSRSIESLEILISITSKSKITMYLQKGSRHHLVL